MPLEAERKIIMLVKEVAEKHGFDMSQFAIIPHMKDDGDGNNVLQILLTFTDIPDELIDRDPELDALFSSIMEQGFGASDASKRADAADDIKDWFGNGSV